MLLHEVIITSWLLQLHVQCRISHRAGWDRAQGLGSKGASSREKRKEKEKTKKRIILLLKYHPTAQGLRHLDSTRALSRPLDWTPHHAACVRVALQFRH